jgi:hypothetical protein
MDFFKSLVDFQGFSFDVHEFNSPQVITKSGSSIGVEGEEHATKE